MNWIYPNIEKYQTQIQEYMKPYEYTVKDTWYGLRWTLENGMWFDLIDYTSKEQVLLRVGRGAWLVKKFPILYGMFDCVKKVIATFEIHWLDTFEQKWFSALLKLLAENSYERWNDMI